MARVFVSHSTEDRDFVEKDVIPFLKRNGIEVWYAQSDLTASADFQDEIRRGLGDCQCVVLVLSERSVKSKWVRAEVAIALDDEGMPVVPLCIEPVSPAGCHLLLKNLVPLRYHEEPDAALDQLVHTLKGHLSRPERAAATPPPEPGHKPASVGPAGQADVPHLFRCLTSKQEDVRSEAVARIRDLGWAQVLQGIEAAVRAGDRASIGAILDGMRVVEADDRALRVMHHLASILAGPDRQKAVRLAEDKGLRRQFDKTAALFERHSSRFELKDVLGQGLFAASYLAVHRATDLEVVVRVLRQEFTVQPRIVGLFTDLANRAMRCDKHQFLLTTLDAGSFPEEAIYYYVRDYVEGPTLRDLLDRARGLHPQQILDLVEQVNLGLGSIHRQSAVHAGVKPSNVYLRGGSEVRLGDMSLPAYTVPLMLDRLAYDFRYAAPETFESLQELTPAADYYSLGCVAYELCCGRPPFVSDDPSELVALHRRGDPDPPRADWLDGDGARFLLKLLSRRPHDRPQELDEVRAGIADMRRALERERVPTSQAPSLLGTRSLMSYMPPDTVVDADDLPTGTLFAGSAPRSATREPAPEIEGYQITAKLSESGSQGTVWQAVQLGTGRAVALKFMRAGAFAGTAARSRFAREVALAAQLEHPNIARVYDSGLHQGAYFYAMELLEGTHLDEYVARRSLSAEGVLRLMLKVCRAIAHAHMRGIVHRDVKPANILVTSDGEPHVMDFGLAKQLDDDLEVTRAGGTVGTIPYMSPEQAMGIPDLDTRTDVYSLGLIMYQLLTGSPARSMEGRAIDVLHRIASEEITPPRKRAKAIDRDLEALLLKALARDRDDRYATAGELADDIDNHLSGRPLHVRKPTTMYFLSKALRKQRVRLAVAALAVVAAVLSTVIYLLATGQ